MKSKIYITGFLLLALVPNFALAALPANGDLPRSLDMVSRWKMTEASGNRVDSGIAGNTLTDNNSVGSSVGPFGDVCADLEASNSESLSISDGAQSGLGITGDLTFAGWINLEQDTGTYTIASKFVTTGAQRSYLFQVDITNFDGLVLYISNDGDAPSNPSVSWDPATGVWYHVAVTYSTTGTVKFYVDGAQIGGDQTGVETPIYDSGSPFALGAWQNQTQNFFDGLQQDFIVYDDDLTSGDVGDLYAAYFSSSSSSSSSSAGSGSYLETSTGSIIIGSSYCNDFIPAVYSGGVIQTQAVCVQWEHNVEIQALHYQAMISTDIAMDVSQFVMTCIFVFIIVCAAFRSLWKKFFPHENDW